MFSFKSVLDPPPISACPKCEYSLRGHEESGVCPECGLEFSSRDLVLEIPRFPPPALIGMQIAPLVLIAPYLVYVGPPGVAWGLIVGFFLMEVVFGWYMPRLFVGGRWAFRPGGIVRYYRGKERRSLRWNSVGDIKIAGGRIRGWSAILITNWAVRCTLPCGKNRDAAEETVKLAQELRAGSGDVSSGG